MSSSRVAFLFYGVCVAACGGSSATGLADAATGVTACTLPPGLTPLDAGMTRDRCTGARMLLTCHGPNGAGAGCLSNDSTQCPDLAGFTCQNQCGDTEYVAACGGVGPGTVPDPPAGCKFASAVPAGIG